MTRTERGIYEIIRTSQAYSAILLVRRALEEETEMNTKLQIASNILDKVIPHYRNTVSLEVQRHMSVHLDLQGLEERCINLINQKVSLDN